jgi:hypothetical protein
VADEAVLNIVRTKRKKSPKKIFKKKLSHEIKPITVILAAEEEELVK